MKRFLYFICFVFSVASFSQDIAVKKDQVLFDKAAVANFEKLGSDFNYKSLNNSNSITATWTYLKISESNVKNYLTIKDAEGKRKSEVVMEFLPGTSNLNMKKAITVLLAKKYNLITINGIENLDVFFTKEHSSITEEIEKEKQENNAIKKDLASVNYQIFLRDKLVFSGNIPQDAFTEKYSKEQNEMFMDKVVATYNVYMKQDQAPTPVLNIDILSLSGRNLVHAVETGGKMVVVLNESKKTFIYTPTSKIDVKDPASQGPFVIELVNTTYLNGQKYMTLIEGKTLLSARETEKADKLEEDKKNSPNIYDQTGYVTDDKGEKLDGKLTIEFEKISTSQSGMVDLDGFGEILKVTAKNDKGKLRVYTYKAKEGVSFNILNDDKSEKKYRAILVKIEDNAPLDLSKANLSSFGLGSASWKYFMDVYSTEKMSISQDLVSKSFVIKVPNKDKGFQILIKKGKEDKFFSKLNEYLGETTKSSDLEKIDYNNVEGLKDLVDLYSKSI